MAVGTFTDFQTLAKSLIGENGEKSTHVRVTDTDVGGQPWRSSGSAETQTVVDAVWFDIKTERTEGDLVQEVTTGMVLIPGTDLSSDPDPTRDYLLRVDGTRWQFIGPGEKIQPNEDTILYQLQVKKT